ncbi:MAG: hypothetical protein M1816_002958 [Peltula sp. TS41687]|nr:MAG: hypothetical protein M1816_002958 [Peltula sp. TS41687]
MARVNSKGLATSRAARLKPSSRRTSHKVIFESFIEEQKNRTVISFNAKPPPGFKFIRAGNPRLTQKCKEVSQEYDKTIYIVSTSHEKARSITQQVHRIGYHFAAVVVKKACKALGLRVSRGGRVHVAPGTLPDASGGQAEHGIAEATVSSQEKINAEARNALAELFPRMPARDNSQIISNAFKEGKKKVGTAENLPFLRRVQLAVLAHIRHVHTDYDHLLRTGACEKLEARARIEQACHRMIVEWSGDEENAKVMREILREVIVISDDEDEDDTSHDEMSVDDSTGEEDSSDQDSEIEFICSRPITRELAPDSSRTEQAKGMAERAETDGGKHNIQGKSAKNGREYDPGSVQPPRRSRKLRMRNRRGFHRYSAIKDLQDDEYPSNNESSVRPYGDSEPLRRNNLPNTRHAPIVDTRYPIEDHPVQRINDHGYHEQSSISPPVPFPHHLGQKTNNIGPLTAEMTGLELSNTWDRDHTFPRPDLHAPASVVDACRETTTMYPRSISRRYDRVSPRRHSSHTAQPELGSFPPMMRQELQGQYTRVPHMAAPSFMVANQSREQNRSSSALEQRQAPVLSIERSQEAIPPGPGRIHSDRYYPAHEAHHERYIYPQRIERIDSTDHILRPLDIRNQIPERSSRRPSYIILSEGETARAASNNAVFRELQYPLPGRDNAPMETNRPVPFQDADERSMHRTPSSFVVLRNQSSPKAILTPTADTSPLNEESHYGKQLPIRTRAARPLHAPLHRTSPDSLFTTRRNDFPSSFRSFVPDHASLAHSQGPLSDFNRSVPFFDAYHDSRSPYAGRGMAEARLDPHAVSVREGLSTHGRVLYDRDNLSRSAEHLQGYQQVMHVDQDPTSQRHLPSESPISRIVPRYPLPSSQASPGHESHARYVGQAGGLADTGLAASVHDANVRYCDLQIERRFPQETVRRSTIANEGQAWWTPERHFQEPQRQQSLASRLGYARVLRHADPYGHVNESHLTPEGYLQRKQYTLHPEAGGMANLSPEAGENMPVTEAGYGFSEPTTPDAQVSYPTSEVLPVDDGQRALRQKISRIWSAASSNEEKGRLMHEVMNEKYRRSQTFAQARHRPRSSSPLSMKSQETSLTLGSTVHRPLSPMSFASGLDPFNPYTVTEDDLKPTYVPADTEASGETVSDADTAEVDVDDDDDDDEFETIPPYLGCQHYRRNVKLQCSTCNKWYTCRFCHNEKEDHMLIRVETRNMLCMLCWCAQPAGEICVNCGERTAWYYCGICKLWDDDSEKSIYHCNDCGICRVGRGLGKDFFHCKTCCVCMSISIADSHKCIERSTDCDCPICGEYMFTSPETVVFMPCGHSIHHKCYYEHMKSSYRCPICSRSIVNMEAQFRNLDRAIESQPMPAQFRDTRALIYCSDCCAKSSVKYHWLGLKCGLCDSYNTAQIRILTGPDPDQPLPSPSQSPAEAETELNPFLPTRALPIPNNPNQQPPIEEISSSVPTNNPHLQQERDRPPQHRARSLSPMDLASPIPSTANEENPIPNTTHATTIAPQSEVEDINFWGGEDPHNVRGNYDPNPSYNDETDGGGLGNEDFELLLEDEDDLSLDHEDEDNEDVDIDDSDDEFDDDDDDDDREEEGDDDDDDDEGDEMELFGHR